MAVALDHTRGGIGAWREQWERSWLARAFSPSSNPYLVHELNLIARDRRFLLIAIITLGLMGMAYRYMGVVANRGALVFLQEMIPLLMIFASFVLLFYRLQRPHIRYHAENAVFLCILPRDSSELLHCQVIAVLFQPLLLFLLLLPGSLLLLGLGVMSPLHLGMKLALGHLILITLAVHGVCRVPRMTTMFLGFPFAFFLFVAAMASIIGSLVALITAMSLSSGTPRNEEIIVMLCLAGVVICAMPVLVWYAMMNPLLTWLMQTTPWGDSLRLSDSLSFLRTPFELMVIELASRGQLSGVNSVALTQAAQVIDALWSIPTISPFNWAFLFAMQWFLMRDALLRGTDQFEYFRVRGYPERLKELRWMERERLRTRNQRALSAQLRPIGSLIERRLPGAATRAFATRLAAWIIRPYAPRMAYRALTMEPDALEAHYAERRRTHAPAQRRAPASHSAVAAPVTLPPPPMPQTPAAPAWSAPPLSQSTPATMPTPVADAIPAKAFSPAARSVVAPLSQAQVTSKEAIDDPAKPQRAAPKKMLWLSRPMGQLFTRLSRLFAAMVPAALRTNPYFMRDWRSMQRVLQGEQEGQWAYSWTVLLVVNISIACFVLFLTCTVQGLIFMGELAQMRRNIGFGQQDAVQFLWAAEFAWVWLEWICVSCPLVYVALPIYAWLKERRRPDWDLTLLSPQMGAGWLAGKWAFFMQLAIIGLAGSALLLMLLDPLLWLGWIVPILALPAEAIWEPLLVNPLSSLAYVLLVLGWMAWAYQSVQLLAFLFMCFPTFQTKSRSFSAVWSLVGIVVTCWILYDIAMSGGLFAILGAGDHPLQDFALAMQQVFLLPLGYLLSFVGSFIAEMFPLTPWRLWNWFWGPNAGPNTADFMIRGVQSTESVLVTLGLYWGLALLHYRLSLHLLQTRLRSLEPRTFSLIRKRVPVPATPSSAPGPAGVV